MGIELRKRNFALALGRLCPEKGFHLAMDAARIAGVPLLVAGEVFQYEAHTNYFRSQIEPRLNHRCRFTGPLGLRAKRRLLTQARCLLVPSLASETSSLVTMEAMACSTPAIAFSTGALPELIDSGRTGSIVNNVREMAEALQHIDDLDARMCREVALQRFSAERMASDYMKRYAEIVSGIC